MTLQNKFWNIFAYTSVTYSAWSFVCGVTICPQVVGCLIAGRNDVLLEFYYLEKSDFRVFVMSLLIKIDGSFNYNLISHSIIREGKDTTITFPFKSKFSHTLSSWNSNQLSSP